MIDRPFRPPGGSADFPSRRLRVRGVDTFIYDVGAGEVPTVCVHGNPDSADTWAPLLARASRLGRVIAPDLPCFGRSERKSPAVFDASLDAYVEWLAAFIDALEVPRYHLVVHDWGSLAMAAAAQRPERLGGLVAINTVPLSAQYRWHWIARWLWRPPIVGEVGMTVFNRFTIKAVKEEARQCQAAVERKDLVAAASAVTDEMAATFVMLGSADEVRQQLSKVWDVADSFTLATPITLPPDKMMFYINNIAETFYG